jgi:hypothetical protein
MLDNPQAATMIALFLLVAAGMFGVFGASIALMFTVLIRLWPRATELVVAEYQAFADAVGGTLHHKNLPRLLGFAGHLPERVAFSHDGRPAELKIVTRGSGEDASTYTCLTVALPVALGFRCQIYKSGTLTRIAEFLGSQDIHVGLPDFDRHFTVKTDNEAQTVRLLTERVQQLLVEFVDWAGIIRDWTVLGSPLITFHFTDATLHIELTAYLNTSAKLMAYVTRGTALADAVAEVVKEHRTRTDNGSPR